MTLLPVIERELRAESRHRATYGLRVSGAVLLVAATALFNAGAGPRNAANGLDLFLLLHRLLLGAIWILVPLMTADCLSREQRENTLGLLFLTPLHAGEIVAAKALTQGLRAAGMAIAVLPILTIPFLLGGVSSTMLLSAAGIQANAFAWALGAGLLASSLTHASGRAMIGALLLSGAFLGLSSITQGWAWLSLNGRPALWPVLWESPEVLAAIGLVVQWTNFEGGQAMFGLPASAAGLGLASSALTGACSAVGLALLWWFITWRVRHSWQEQPPSIRRQKLEARFFRPRFATGLFRRRQQHSMNRNPVGWLETRHWLSRVTTWLWLGGFLLTFSWALSTFTSGGSLAFELTRVCDLLTLALLAFVALVSAASFRRERETGVLELLLTTPLPPEQILRGRLRAIWGQFLPTMVLLVALRTAFPALILVGSSSGTPALEWFVGLVIQVCCVSSVGLWISLRSRHAAPAFLLTLLLTLAVPQLVVQGGRPLLAFVAHALSPAAAQVLSLSLTSTTLILTAVGLVQLFQSGASPNHAALLALFGCVGLSLFPALSGLSDLRAEDERSAWEIVGPGALQLWLAGQAQSRLLRDLRHRTFAFKL